ncbi:MAG TPA: hypothetical protein PKH96_11780, partial [Gemmatimonadaceae bacterium]|nr:hypothetical protein [Gemmatimonadaceae bacterium]
MRSVPALLAAVLLTPLLAAAQPAVQKPSIDPSVYARLPWRTIGPEGNRFTAAAGIAGDPLTYYVGAASGGVWK